MNNPRTLVIDTSYLTYKSYFAFKNITHQGKSIGAFYGFAKTVMKLVEEFQPSRVIFARDLPQPTWRHKEYPEYKAGRTPPEPEMVEQIPIINEWCKSITDNVFAVEGFEADDIIYTICCQLFGESINKEPLKNGINSSVSPYFPFDQASMEDANTINYSACIFSSDKDLYQLFMMPNVSFIKIDKVTKKYHLYTQEDFYNEYQVPPQLWLDYKTLVGDSSDNLKGLPRVGPKTAQKILTETGSLRSIFNYMKIDSAGFNYYSLKESVVESIAEKNQKTMSKIKENTDILRQTYRLSGLALTPGININESLNFENGREFFEKYNFRSLIQKLPQQPGIYNSSSEQLF